MFELINEDELKITNQIYFKDIKDLKKIKRKKLNFIMINLRNLIQGLKQ